MGQEFARGETKAQVAAFSEPDGSPKKPFVSGGPVLSDGQGSGLRPTDLELPRDGANQHAIRVRIE